MSKRITIILTFTFLFLTVPFKYCYSQGSLTPPLKLMFYNVENAFDIFDDTVTNDEEFLPEGIRRWNLTRYNRKIAGLYKTIVAAGEWDPPGIVAFCEVENKRVLEDLLRNTYLLKYNYRIIHSESPDRRGIDVCLIYRKDIINLLCSAYWIPTGMNNGEFKSRSVLYSKMVYNSDTIHLFVNHWPSRKGGVLAGEDLRLKIASMVREKADSINSHTWGGAKILIMGDFNSAPDDLEMKSLIAPFESVNFLVNLSGKEGTSRGTYKYMGIWEMFDQVIVSKALLACRQGLWADMNYVTIYKPDFLLVKDPKYPGSMPYSTYRGLRYQGGFSDHLPVLIRLDYNSQSQPE